MRISAISSNYYQNNNTNFKSAVPVFVHICTDGKEALPLIGEEMNNTFMLKIVHMLNRTLKRGINKERDDVSDWFVKFFGSWVEDYRNNRVLAFTCVDGEFEEGILKPYFYLTTGKTKAEIIKLRQKHNDAARKSKGYLTANLKLQKDIYYNKGKDTVLKAFKDFKPFGGAPKALFAYFKPIRNTNGVINDYILYSAEFKEVDDIKKPSIRLNK